jgi:hypothetical protein
MAGNVLSRADANLVHSKRNRRIAWLALTIGDVTRILPGKLLISFLSFLYSQTRNDPISLQRCALTDGSADLRAISPMRSHIFSKTIFSRAPDVLSQAYDKNAFGRESIPVAFLPHQNEGAFKFPEFRRPKFR